MTPADLRQWFTGEALPLWWARGADPRGGFHEALDQGGRPVEAPRRLRVQARQTAVYAGAGALGWTGPWREACLHGLDFLLGPCRRPDGLFRALVSPEGESLDETARLYDQAFGLYALAEAARALPDRMSELLTAAEAVRAGLTRHPVGGFVEQGAHPFQSNAHMHLLEAAMAWEETAPAPDWGALADEIVALALTRFVDRDAGFLREFFAEDWAPAAGPDGRIVEPGHQFEWAWLLERYGRARSSPEAVAAARRLYRIGADHGVEPTSGVAINALDDTLVPLDPAARLWPQTERIKAAAAFEPEAVEAAVRGLGLYLGTAVPGLWFDRLNPNGRFVAEPAPASSFYHIAGAVAALAPARAPS